MWCLPVDDADAWARTKPEEVWRRLLTSRAPNSLVSYLKRQAIAIGMPDPGMRSGTRMPVLV